MEKKVLVRCNKCVQISTGQLPSTVHMHDLLIQFRKLRSPFTSVHTASGNLELVSHSEILGVTISDNLKWNKHVAEIIKKTNKRMLGFVIQVSIYTF